MLGQSPSSLACSLTLRRPLVRKTSLSCSILRVCRAVRPQGIVVLCCCADLHPSQRTDKPNGEFFRWQVATYCGTCALNFDTFKDLRNSGPVVGTCLPGLVIASGGAGVVAQEAEVASALNRNLSNFRQCAILLRIIAR